MQAFLAAAMKRGAYEEQVRTLSAAIDAATDSIEELQSLEPVASRLLINISCRIDERRPALRPLRDSLSAHLSLIRQKCKRLGHVPTSPHRPSPRRFPTASSTELCSRRTTEGPRHICEHGCYFFAYEPARLLHAFLADAAALGHSREAYAGWRAACRPFRGGAGDDDADDTGTMPTRGAEEGMTSANERQGSATDRPPRKRRRVPAVPARVFLLSPDGVEFGSKSDALRSLDGVAAVSDANRLEQPGPVFNGSEGGCHGGVVVRSRFFASSDGAAAPVAPSSTEVRTQASPWRPPQSPLGLLEEVLWDRPWALLLCCILLNQTSRAQVDPVLARLLAAFPDAASLASADVAQIEELLRPLGLHRRRARTLIAFSAAFLKGEWRKPEDLPGIGRYGSEAHELFCRGQWRELEPQDHALRWYIDWIRTLDDVGPGRH